MKKGFFIVLTIASFVFLLGSVGSADCEMIGVEELLTRCSISILTFGGGLFALSLH